MKKKPEGLDYLPTSGVRTDLKRFMNKYLEHNTVRYEQFVEVWRDKKMVYLCAGRASDREAREFVEKVLLIAQEYFLPPYQFQVRVGGLYLLYAIYQIQPLSPKVKIRLTSSQWQDSVLFQQQAAQQNHLDVVYVFQRLLQEQAFLFCYTSSEMSIHSAIKETEETGDDLADRLKEEKTAVTSLFNYESLEKLSYIQDQYQQMKIGLAGPSATRPDKSLDVALTELVEDVVVLLQSFKEKVSSFSRQGQKPDGTTDQEPVVETTGSRRQMLKSQAYSQPKSRTNTRQGHSTVSSSSTSPAKTAISGAGDSGHVAHTDKRSSPVASSTQRPARSSGPQHVSNISQSDDDDDDSDQDYVPSPRPSPATRLRRQTKPRDHRQMPLEQQPSEHGSAGQERSLMSMPMIVDQDVDSLLSPRRSPQCTKTSRREVLAEQNSGTDEPPQVSLPARKRGRPRKFSDLMEESFKTPNKKHPGQENCGRECTAARSEDQDVGHSQDSSAMKNKVAFKFRTEKRAEQPGSLRLDAAEQPGSLRLDAAEQPGSLRLDAAKSQTPPRRRGRPRKCYSEKAEVAREHKRTFYADSMDSSGGKKARFELVVFPTGRLPSDLHASSSSADPAADRTEIPGVGVDSSSLSRTVQQFTSRLRQTQDVSEIEAVSFETADWPNKTKVRRKRAANNSVTVTEIVVGKEVGKPAVIQSQKVHKRVIDKCLPTSTSATTPAAQTSPKQTSDTHVVPGTSTSGSESSADEADDVEESQSSQLLKAVKKYGTGDSLNRLKKQCRRQLEEEDSMSVAQFVKRFVSEDREAQLSNSLSKTSGKTAALRQPSVTSQHNSEPSVKSQQKIEVWRNPSVKSQQNTAVLKKLLSGQPATTGQLAGVKSPQMETQDHSPHKVSAAKHTKTVSKDILPPWTSKCRSSSRPKQKFCPKIKDKTEVDPSLVQFRFL